MKEKEPSPLERAIYLLEDIPVCAGVLPAEGRRALVEGLESARRRFAASSESELQGAANDLLSLVESYETWRVLLLPAGMPDLRQREQWLEVHEEELQTSPEKSPGVEELARLRENIELRFQEAITALLEHDDEDADE